MVLAQTFLALPFVVGITMAAVEAVPPDLILQVRSLGASPWQARLAVLREARSGIALAVATALGQELLRGRGGPDRRRQHRGPHPGADDGHRPGDRQGRLRRRPGPRRRAARPGPGRQRPDPARRRQGRRHDGPARSTASGRSTKGYGGTFRLHIGELEIYPGQIVVPARADRGGQEHPAAPAGGPGAPGGGEAWFEDRPLDGRGLALPDRRGSRWSSRPHAS